MNKKLIALAVAGVFAPAVALAQGTNVTIYGTLNADIEYVKADGATPNVAPLFGNNGIDTDSRQRVSSNSSNIGFRIREDLGGGMTAWAQCESSANVDAGGGTLCSRNTGLGVEGAFGNVFLGSWDTPYKSSTGGLDPMGNTSIAAYVGIFGSPGFNVASFTGANGGTSSSAALSFDRRQNNTVNYWTPNWGGFQAKLMYGANEEKTNVTAFQLDPSMWSASITYDNGPLYITGAYEKHNDYLASAGPTLGLTSPVTGGDDTAWKLGAGFKFGNFQIIGMYESLEYEADTGLGTFSASRDAWLVGVNYVGGAWKIGANYEDADSLDCFNCGDTGAKQYSLRVGYSLSKRTEVYALYTQIDNDDFAQYNFGINPLQGPVTGFAAGISEGADPQGIALGLRHTF